MHIHYFHPQESSLYPLYVRVAGAALSACFSPMQTQRDRALSDNTAW